MHRSTVMRLALALALAVVTTVSVPVRATGADKFEGTINEYTDPASAIGSWQLTGKWSVHIKGTSGKADFTASIAMVRPGSGASPHTHHVLLQDATVTTTANGWNIEGEPTITSNGGGDTAGRAEFGLLLPLGPVTPHATFEAPTVVLRTPLTIALQIFA